MIDREFNHLGRSSAACPGLWFDSAARARRNRLPARPRSVPADGGRARPRAARPATGWRYEPKWDGFRGVLENVGGELALWSRNGRPLLRYFPELRPLGELLPPRSALDGEIVIARDGALDFDAMQMRLHPAESRIRRLSGEIPAEFVAFDVLLWNGEARVEAAARGAPRAGSRRSDGFRLSPATRDVDEARGWLDAVRGARARRRRSPSGSACPICRARARGRQGQGAQDGGLRRRRPALEGRRPDDDRDAAARPLPRGRRVSTTSARAPSPRDARRGGGAGAAAARARRPTQRFSEPNRWGSGELEAAVRAPELVVEVRYDKVQGSAVPPRHEADPLARRQGPSDCTWRELRPPRDPNAPRCRDAVRVALRARCPNRLFHAAPA